MGIKTGTKTVESSLPYQAYVVSSSLEEQPEKTGEGQYAAPALIVVNHAMLRKYLETNKVILGGDSVVIKENVKAGRPNFLERRRNNTQ